ncbi:conserved Plasmodium protein, unknown function [Plasmodium knowlesi strain H]|uniref:DnaJ protein n=3 Tax=Plasmodium knowlesi TaxID=5850 RepID=A0A5E7X6U2_PLAKH|nr:uncharacterized protein PKNH_1347000 [Plasmodium knowlesi strain H]OTN67659.1 Uncharacterized protein PKNOH_S05390800 [Plasmodium knowlesi]CAA9990495.1 DnaJ protein, putative [Plasmodium knowlesi strain H]SBO19723.1 conserved Plasmodium protein, unknown function [Plasmodium knowlesi strain H]SBO22468.1 conserved Plasmodium protein, unknown function [Plasmodium knowlesi strain H]VVS79969.1 DnaJ protein, putative [Plasmodium knowlesi strain H]
MDLFSIASNLQQIAIGGVNFVNNKLRKKSVSTECNYITYIVIGENEKQPYDTNIFFLPFKICGKIKLKEFKEFFPFKDNVIFRFKIPVVDLIDVINEGIVNHAPLMKEDTNEQNKEKNIISDENEIKNILRQDQFSHLWVDITNEEAYIPFYNSKIVVKVLFINNEEYREYTDIYFKNFQCCESNRPIYTLNDTNPCSYIVLGEEENDKRNSTDNEEEEEEEEEKDHYFDEHMNETSPSNHLKNRHPSNHTDNIPSSHSNNKHTHHLEDEAENFVHNEYVRNDPQSEATYKKGYPSEMPQHKQHQNNANRKREDDNFFQSIKKEASKNKASEYILQKNSYTSTTNLLLSGRSNVQGGYEDMPMGRENNGANSGPYNSPDVDKKERQDVIKANVSNRLQELKDFRTQEEAKFKEKVILSEHIKKQIVKWSKNLDGSYKDVKVMLSTLNEVLWDDSEWRQVPMSELISNSTMVKKAYKSAILLCHPDKHRGKPVERVLRAEMIFQALNNAYKEKKNM